LADKGWERATAEDAGLAAGLNIVRGTVVHPAVARELGLPIAARAAEKKWSGARYLASSAQ
jgi:alanine dehydrogenase